MKNKDIIVIFAPKGLTLDTQEISCKTYFNEALLPISSQFHTEHCPILALRTGIPTCRDACPSCTVFVRAS